MNTKAIRTRTQSDNGLSEGMVVIPKTPCLPEKELTAKLIESLMLLHPLESKKFN